MVTQKCKTEREKKEERERGGWYNKNASRECRERVKREEGMVT
jgi:hypothetical protein